MALDIHLGKTEDEASHTERVLWLGINLHASIFYKNDFDGKNYSQLAKMKDYYADALYSDDDILALKYEIDSLLNITEGNLETQKFLQLFSAVCTEANLRGENIYCFCD